MSRRSNKSNLVFVVDDCSLYRDFIRIVLEYEGYRVSVFKNGDSILETLRKAIPDMIISDIEMPEMDGFALHAEIQKHYPKVRQVPFVFITSNSDPEVLNTAMNLTQYPVIEKSILTRSLTQLVNKSLVNVNKLPGWVSE